jgi:hypothetical protein
VFITGGRALEKPAQPWYSDSLLAEFPTGRRMVMPAHRRTLTKRTVNVQRSQ